MLNPVGPDFATALRRILPDAAFRADSAPYLDEPRGVSRGQAGLVVAPDTVEGVLLRFERLRMRVSPLCLCGRDWTCIGPNHA